MAKAVADSGVLRLVPQKGARERGGIELEALAPVQATSQAYTGTAGSSSVVFDITSRPNEMLDLSRSFVETQFFVQVGKNGLPATTAVAQDDRIALKNGAGGLMWNRIDLRLNGTQINDPIHAEAGPGPGVAGFFDVLENKAAPFGTANQSRAVLPGSGDRTAARVDLGAIGKTARIVAGVAAGDMTFTSGLTGSDGGQAGPIMAWSFAGASYDPTVAASADSSEVSNHGEQEVSTFPAAKWSLGRALVGSSAANPAVVVYKPATTLFTQVTPLTPGSRVRLELFKNPAAMWLQSEHCAAVAGIISGVQVNYVRCRFWAHRITLPQASIDFVSEYLAQTAYNYAFISRRMFTDTLAVGQQLYQKSGILQGPMPSRVYIFLSRGLIYSSDANNLRQSPWAMSSSTRLVASATATAGTHWESNEIPGVAELYVRIGNQQFPNEPFRSTVGAEADLFRAYALYATAARKSLVAGAEQPVLSYDQFVQNYTFYTIDLQADPSNEIATSVSTATSALASTAGLEVYLNLKTAVAATAADYDSPGLRLAVVAESPAAIEVSASGGVLKLGF